MTHVHKAVFNTNDLQPNKFRLVLAVEKGSWARACRVVDVMTGKNKELNTDGNNDRIYPTSTPSFYSNKFCYDSVWIDHTQISNIRLEFWKYSGTWSWYQNETIDLANDWNYYSNKTVVFIWRDDNSTITNLVGQELPAPTANLPTRDILPY
ncbi:hypothetical protein PPL_06688 [Heterostelium album PN500]|uniref:Uncharacterized protein n=1 Tax=Heterostelium pallidum (strain ATCC 26659 / Pp 5 / PN500) TaxID=670386 RepID=D3BFF4_HETP5|nr:hypothetical protein PPL_06688 [Heterostelium album PN500]EFA79868.1 hypothetical protein PPL_06688 [Heterostelium album PN500]|eukprot:XP_020431989.1 hypothetical protein PPL_06688 [Heterostelium album PN500]